MNTFTPPKEKTRNLINKLNELKNAITEQKNSEEFKNYLKSLGNFHNYSFNNTILILSQMPKATKVAGYRQWQSMNRYVKKGETGIHILIPLIFKNKTETDEKKESARIWFKSGTVFDLSQTEGEPLPSWDITTPEQEIKIYKYLEEAIEEDNIAIEYTDEINAYGISSMGKIEIRASENKATQFTTLIHEYSHEILHKRNDRKTMTHEEKEIEAETVSYIVSQHFGIESTSDKYLATWIERDDIFNHLEKVRKASSYIIQKIEEKAGLIAA